MFNKKIIVRIVVAIPVLGFLFLFFAIGQFFIPGVGAALHPMHAAIRYEIVPLVKILSYTPLRDQKQTGLKGGCIKPLELAASLGLKEITGILIDSGADIYGCRKTVLAASVSYPYLLEYLLNEKNIDPNLHDEWRRETPIFEALYCRGALSNERKRSLEILLEHGANPNFSRNPKGKFKATETPLYYAADGNCLETVKILLRYGADPIPAADEFKKHLDRYNNQSKDFVKKDAEEKKGAAAH